MSPIRLAAAALAAAFVLVTAPAAEACTPLDPEHGAFSALLRQHVDRGVVDYAGWKQQSRPALEAYLASLAGVCRDDLEQRPPADQIAFWINAYNAATIKLILDHHPVKSIRSIGWLPLAAFREPLLPLAWKTGGTMSLEDIEHRVLRKDFAEPRIHFAIVCASKSCPPLAAEAYTGAALDAQLDRVTRGFLADPKLNRWDAATKTLSLSKIFDWFEEDFAKAAGSVPAFVAPYFGEHAAAIRGPGVTVKHLDYDWSLNGR